MLKWASRRYYRFKQRSFFIGMIDLGLGIVNFQISVALSAKITAAHGYINCYFPLEPVQSRRASLQELRRDAIVQADLSPQLSQA